MRRRPTPTAVIAAERKQAPRSRLVPAPAAAAGRPGRHDWLPMLQAIAGELKKKQP